jgi:hypothetical protein
MDDREDALEQAIQHIAALFAEAYLRLRLESEAQKGLASSETPSPHVTGRLTA